MSELANWDHFIGTVVSPNGDVIVQVVYDKDFGIWFVYNIQGAVIIIKQGET